MYSFFTDSGHDIGNRCEISGCTFLRQVVYSQEPLFIFSIDVNNFFICYYKLDTALQCWLRRLLIAKLCPLEYFISGIHLRLLLALPLIMQPFLMLPLLLQLLRLTIGKFIPVLISCRYPILIPSAIFFIFK